jgi:hypothetical protein
MQPISLLQIAPTLAAFFGIPLAAPEPPVRAVLDFMNAREPRPPVVLLLVIDSLDLELYAQFRAELPVLHTLADRDGLLFSAEPVSSHTTPAIASMLTGLPPEAHGIVVSADVGTSTLKSILELLDEAGHPTAAVLNTSGAEPLIGRMSYVYRVEDREDILAYDALITAHTLTAVRNQEVQFVFTHLRTIDRFAHRGGDLRLAARVTNSNVQEIAGAVHERRGILVICGDHEAHLPARRALHGPALPIPVPLIVAAP